MVTLFWTSLWISALTALGSLVAGGLSALWIAGATKWVGRFAVGLLVVGAALPSFLVVDAWLELLGSSSLPHRWLGVSLFSGPGVLWVMLWIHWPLATLWLYSSWSRVDRATLECDPRVRGLRFVSHLLLPMTQSSVTQTGLLVFGLSMNQFTVPSLLQAKTLPVAIWVDFNTTYDFGSALLKCVPQWILLGLLARRLKWVGFEGIGSCGTARGGELRRALGKGMGVLCGVFFAASAFFSVILPLVSMGGSWKTWEGLGTAAHANQASIGRTVVTGIGAATLAVLWGCLFARCRSGWMLWGGFWMPGVMIGIALVALLNRPGLGWLYQSWGVVLIGLCIRYSGIGWSAARAGFAEAGRQLHDDFRMCGGASWRFMALVQAPIAASKLAAAWYVVYLLSLWDVEILSIVAPPGSQTLSLLMFNLLHYGHTTQVMSMGVVLVALALAPLAVWMLWRRVGILLGLGLLAGCGSGLREDERELRSGVFQKCQVIGARGVGLGQFNKPRSVAVDGMGRLFVADMTGRVQRFSAEGEYQAHWQMPQTELGKPKGMCWDGAGSIVVIEPHYARMNHFTAEGALGRQWGVRGQLPGQFTQPRAVAVNRHGEIYVAEFGEGERVQRFSLATGALLGVWGKEGVGPGEFSRPEGIAVDSTDRVYIADSCNHRVQVFDREGKFLREFGAPGSGLGEMSYPYDVQVDGEGRIFVCEFGNSRIQVFDEKGVAREVIGGPGDEPGKLHNPWSLALDSQGNLFVADSGNHRVQKFARRH